MLVDFYHLVSSPLERVLPPICEKVLAGGGRMLVVADQPLLGQIDSQLWGYARDAFLPHGRSDGPGPETQPILLASEPIASNGARTIALADGEWRDEALQFDRAFYFFDAGHLQQARASWRALGEKEGVERRYWKQDEQGKWTQGP
jgi:DNA polymerase-3 subunit chi